MSNAIGEGGKGVAEVGPESRRSDSSDSRSLAEKARQRTNAEKLAKVVVDPRSGAIYGAVFGVYELARLASEHPELLAQDGAYAL